jgi:multifunctional beta-oxidation protein
MTNTANGPTDAAVDLSPDHSARVIAFLVHDSNKTENGSILEAGAGRVARLRWQRSRGLLLRADESLHPHSVLDKWSQVENFNNAEYSSGPNEFLDLLKEGSSLPANKADSSKPFAGKVVLITGAGSGWVRRRDVWGHWLTRENSLGRAYALHFAKLGASVAVNDIKDPSEVVNSILSIGGKAVAIVGPAEDGHRNVSATIQAFGRIDVLVNNAGIILDKAFHNMNESMWDKVLSVHLRGTYMNSRAAWPHFTRQKYGRIVNTVSVTGIYGNFGQANYAAAVSVELIYIDCHSFRLLTWLKEIRHHRTNKVLGARRSREQYSCICHCT